MVPISNWRWTFKTSNVPGEIGELDPKIPAQLPRAGFTVPVAVHRSPRS